MNPTSKIDVSGYRHSTKTEFASTLRPHFLSSRANSRAMATKQIGKEVPVNLAKALTKQLLVGKEASHRTYLNQEVEADD